MKTLAEKYAIVDMFWSPQKGYQWLPIVGTIKIFKVQILVY